MLAVMRTSESKHHSRNVPSLIASRTFEELIQCRGSGLIPFLGLLNRFGRAVALQIIRVDSKDCEGTSILDVVSGIPGFQPGRGKQWRVASCGVGHTWRKKPAQLSFHPTPAVVEAMGAIDLSRFHEVPPKPSDYGLRADEGAISDTNERYLLMLHPWGHSRLDMVRIPDCGADMDDGSVRNSSATRFCARCGRHFHDANEMKEICIFHPGKDCSMLCFAIHEC